MDYSINSKDMKNLILNGTLQFSVKSIPTSKHYSYRIVRPEDKDAWFVRCRYHKSWQYICYFKDDFIVHTSAKSALPYDSEQVKGIKFIMKNIDNLPDELVFCQITNCMVCGQRLTTPESIKLGVGPCCYKKLQTMIPNIDLESARSRN